MEVVRRKPEHGWIEVVTGSMFSGKSEELIRRLRRAQIAKQKVQIFKPLIDNRYSEDHIVSHSDMRMASQNVRNSDELLAQVDDDTEVVGIDEGQFFDAQLPGAGTTLPNLGKRVVGAGPGFPRAPMRADAAAAGHRRVHHQNAGDLRRLRGSGEPHAAPGG